MSSGDNELRTLTSFQRKKLIATLLGRFELQAWKLLYHGPKYIIYPAKSPFLEASLGYDLEKEVPQGMEHEETMLKTKDGAQIKCFFLPAYEIALGEEDSIKPSRRTMMMCHGNTGGMGGLLPIARRFNILYRCSIFLFSYRGYGDSTGCASEKGIRIDAQTALDYVLQHPLVNYQQGVKPKVVLYGVSLGGAVALDLASRNAGSISALIIENTFVSIPRMIAELFPSSAWFVRSICFEKWDNSAAISTLPSNIPLLMLSGLRDEVIPPTHMKELWSVFQQKSPSRAVWKEFVWGKHNDLSAQPDYFTTVGPFLHQTMIEDRP